MAQGGPRPAGSALWVGVDEADGAGDRAGVSFTSLDDVLFDGAGATKRDLVDHLDAVSGRILPELEGRALSVIRARPGQSPFMQKNLPKSTPAWVRRTSHWAEGSKRDVTYALCDDRRTLLWFANQRAVEYHPAMVRDAEGTATHLVVDLDPPEGGPFAAVVGAATLVRRALGDAGLDGAVKTSGSKGLHIFVPVVEGTPVEDAAAATRAIVARVERLGPEETTTAFAKADREGKVFLDATRSGGGTIVAAYSPRIRPGAPVSFPVRWDELDQVVPSDFTILTAAALLGDGDPWRDAMPAPVELPGDLVDEGRAIPLGRVEAMHEGKRRARGARSPKGD